MDMEQRVWWPLLKSMVEGAPAVQTGMRVCNITLLPHVPRVTAVPSSLTAPLAVPAQACLDVSLVLANAVDVAGALVQLGPGWHTPTLIQVPLAPPV